MVVGARYSDGCLEVGRSVRLCLGNKVRWSWFYPERLKVEGICDALVEFLKDLFRVGKFKIKRVDAKGINSVVECKFDGGIWLVIMNDTIVLKFGEGVLFWFERLEDIIYVMKDWKSYFIGRCDEGRINSVINYEGDIWLDSRFRMYVDGLDLVGAVGEIEMFRVNPFEARWKPRCLVKNLVDVSPVFEWVSNVIKSGKTGRLKLKTETGKLKELTYKYKDLFFVVGGGVVLITYDDGIKRGEIYGEYEV